MSWENWDRFWLNIKLRTKVNLQERLQSLHALGILKEEKREIQPKDFSLVEYLGGKTISNAKGEYVQVERCCRESYRHGSVCLSDLMGSDSRTISFLAKKQLPQGIELNKTIFLDTETTGLAGGSGTYPFLVGVGYFDSGQFLLKQFFMRDYGEERALLADLSELLTRYPYIVTYNGKGYDIPILKTRYILNRIKTSLEFEGHLDLLFPARRVWKQRVKDCSLSNLENVILGVEREIDIPSYMIPQAYFDFLRSGEKEKIKLILEHNAGDIVSLAALLAHLCQILERPEKLEELHPEDLFSLGRQFYFASDYERAGWCWQKSAQRGSSEVLFLQCYLWLGRLYKRRGEWDKAEKTWQHIIREHNRFCLEPYLELAKFYEHRAKDCQQALKLVELAIDNQNASLSVQKGMEILPSLYLRKGRLLRKLEQKNSSGKTLSPLQTGQKTC